MTIEHRLLTPQESSKISEKSGEEAPQSLSKNILRPKLMNRVKTLAAAGVLAAAGGMIPEDADAQQIQLNVTRGQTNTRLIYHAPTAPRLVEARVTPEAAQVLASIGLSYKTFPLSIYKQSGEPVVGMPDTKNKQLSLKVERENSNSVVITSIYLDKGDNDQRRIQTTMVGYGVDPKTNQSGILVYRMNDVAF